MGMRFRIGCLTLLGVAGFVAFGITLETACGIPFDLTYRIACAVACLVMMVKIGADQGKERWFRVSLFIALVFNASLFLTPILHRPASRGEIMIFALPDAAVFFFGQAIGYPTGDEHQRAVRQQLFVGSLLAFAVAALLLAASFIPDRSRPPHLAHTVYSDVQTLR